MYMRGQRVGRTALAHRVLRGWALLLALGLSPPAGTASVRAASDDVEARYNLMAAFLYNFTAFVNWPEDAKLDQGPITIGVLGENPFASAAPAIEKKTVNGRPIRFRSFAEITEVEPTHILFVGRNLASQLGEVRKRLQGHAVLTVGETDDFTRQGGVVRFYEVAAAGGEADRTIRLEINEKLAQDLKLQIRSKLLRLATVVEHPPPPIP